MHACMQGIDYSRRPEYNVDTWLDPKSPHYKPELAEAVFYYQARTNSAERFEICIHTEEMKKAAWKYTHQQQLILDGTFGISDSRLLLFIGMGIDEQGKGVPLVFLLFSAPTGSQATHAGYDTEILKKLMQEWVVALGTGPQGEGFCPKIAITDTDTKERGALIMIWPSIFLLLCKFHVRNAWANRRKTLIKMGQTLVFSKHQVIVRATLGAAADPSHMLTRGNPKVYQKQEYTPEPGISPNKGKSKDKSLEITLLESPPIY